MDRLELELHAHRGSNCREIVDNVTDMAHFYYIHFGLPTYFKNVFEGHIASQYLHNVGRPDVGGMGTAYGESHLDSEASYFGPSFMINWLHNTYGDFKAESILINCHYPVSQDSFVLQWGVIVQKPKGLDDAMSERLSSAFTDGVSKGFLQDVEIWKHKTRIDNPLLVEGTVRSTRCAGGTSSSTSMSPTSPGDDRPVRTRGGHHQGQREVECRGRGEPASAGRPGGRAPGVMTPEQPLDIDELARSMLLLHGAHDDRHPSGDDDDAPTWSKAPDFAGDPSGPPRSMKPVGLTGSATSLPDWPTSTAASATPRSG